MPPFCLKYLLEAQVFSTLHSKAALERLPSSEHHTNLSQDILNWQRARFQILPCRFLTEYSRWSHNFHEAMLSRLSWHVPISKELQANEKCSPVAQVAPEGTPGEFIVTYGKCWQTASLPPSKGKEKSTNKKQTEKITDWDITAALNLTSSCQVVHRVTHGYSVIRTSYQANPFALTPSNNDSHDIYSCSLACQITLLISSLQNKHQLP